MQKQTAAERKADKLINEIYTRNCSGVQISVMDIPKVFKVGREAIAKGFEGEALRTVIVGYVDTIRQN
jgi:hypothetical protein